MRGAVLLTSLNQNTRKVVRTDTPPIFDLQILRQEICREVTTLGKKHLLSFRMPAMKLVSYQNLNSLLDKKYDNEFQKALM